MAELAERGEPRNGRTSLNGCCHLGTTLNPIWAPRIVTMTKAQGDQFMLVESTAFIAAILVIACVILGGLARVCWHTRPQDTGKPHKKPLLSNWK
jgi:hypothetical protein